MSEKDLGAIVREEAELAEKEVDTEDDVWVPTRRRAKDPSMVYSVRIPVARVDELRRVAVEAGMDPSAMVRRWVLERLDAERRGGAHEDLREMLGQVTEALERIREAGRSVGWLVLPERDALPEMFKLTPAGTGVRARRSAAAKATGKAAKQSPDKGSEQPVAKKAVAKKAAPKKETRKR